MNSNLEAFPSSTIALRRLRVTSMSGRSESFWQPNESAKDSYKVSTVEAQIGLSE